MIPLKTDSGEEKAWLELAKLDPLEICRRASVSNDGSTCTYVVTSFGINFYVSANEKKITTDTAAGKQLLCAYRDFFVPSVLLYLLEAKNIPETGRLVSPSDIKGGQIFSQGTHLLPLDMIADRYGSDKDDFYTRGLQLGGQMSSGGDGAIKLYPFPQVPVTVLLWLADDEFPARAGLLFDSSCNFIVPVDVLWATAMVSVLMMQDA